jgi:hypothetical protein
MAFQDTPRADEPPDALTLLRIDHERIRQLFSDYGRLRDDEDEDEQKAALVDDLCHALTVHGMLEDEIFYPVLRAALDDTELLDEAEEEHMGMRELVARLEVMYPGDEHFDALLAVLAEEVVHHVAREEADLFEAVRTAGVDLMRLGRRLAARRREIEDDLDPVEGMIDAMEPHEGMRRAPRAPD